MIKLYSKFRSSAKKYIEGTRDVNRDTFRFQLDD